MKYSRVMLVVAFSCLSTLALSKQKLSMGWENKPRSFDPRFSIDAHSQYLDNLLHCSLVDFDHKGEVVADLAKKWQWLNDKTLQVELNQGVKFADGTSVTASDVKATFDFFARKDLENKSPKAHTFSDVVKVEVAKDNKITFHLANPDSSFLPNLSIGIMPKKYGAQDKVMLSGDKIPGCGPFKLQKSTINSLLLTRNDNYTLGTQSKLDELEIKIVKDQSTRFAKLQKGELDLLQNSVSFDKISDLEKKYPGLRKVKTESLRTTYVGFNTKDPILKDPNVRKAISMAINRQALVDYIMQGNATPAATMLPPQGEYFNNKVKVQGLDLAGATKLLDQAGLKPNKKGVRFKLSYKTTTDQTRFAIARAVASDLKKVGIEVKVVPLEWGRFRLDVEKGRIQLWGLSWVGFKTPDIYRYAFGSDSIPPNGANRGHFMNAELDKLLNLAKTTIDKSKRKQYYLKAQEIIADHTPYAFLFHDHNVAVMNKKVQGFQVFADGRYSALRSTFKQ